MKKTIYLGKPEGLYESLRFLQFIAFLDAKEDVPEVVYNVSKLTNYVCYFNKSNVTLDCSFDPAITKIQAFGKEEDVSKIEKIILEEAKQFGELVKNQ